MLTDAGGRDRSPVQLRISRDFHRRTSGTLKHHMRVESLEIGVWQRGSLVARRTRPEGSGYFLFDEPSALAFPGRFARQAGSIVHLDAVAAGKGDGSVDWLFPTDPFDRYPNRAAVDGAGQILDLSPAVQ